MSDNLKILTSTKGAVLVLEHAASDGLPLPQTVHLSSCSGTAVFIMAEPAGVYLWAEAFNGDVKVSESHDGSVTHWDWAGDWFDQPLRVTTNRRNTVAVSA